MELELNETEHLPQDLSGDLSRRAIKLARAIDRLRPDEQYVIHLKKSSIKAQPWEVVISIEQMIHVWKIDRK